MSVIVCAPGKFSFSHVFNILISCFDFFRFYVYYDSDKSDDMAHHHRPLPSSKRETEGPGGSSFHSVPTLYATTLAPLLPLSLETQSPHWQTIQHQCHQHPPQCWHPSTPLHHCLSRNARRGEISFFFFPIAFFVPPPPLLEMRDGRSVFFFLYTYFLGCASLARNAKQGAVSFIFGIIFLYFFLCFAPSKLETRDGRGVLFIFLLTFFVTPVPCLIHETDHCQVWEFSLAIYLLVYQTSTSSSNIPIALYSTIFGWEEHVTILYFKNSISGTLSKRWRSLTTPASDL